ncbi:hypothetical protein Acr_16g0006430 [Actinidia rufa]|uniref:RING/U-box superfamily protein n=1 Tax=Actinidia rufa TaxID=165716 RepID=A0A7J0FZ97_9ERIC|nr:hypothetical protein Acr_16g0006430 [Actinidia rufa]
MGIRGNAGGGYEMTRQGGEAGSYIHEPRLKDFVGLGGQNMFSRLSSFQNKIGGLTSPVHNAGGWATANNNVGLIRGGGTNTGLKSSPFHNLQKPQADTSNCFPESSNTNLGVIGNRDLRHLSIDPYKSLCELAASSGPFSSGPASLLDSGQYEASVLASESVKFNRTTTQQTSDQLQKRLMETMQLSPESCLVSSFTGFKGNRQENSSECCQSFHIPPYFHCTSPPTLEDTSPVLASKDSPTQAVDQSAQIPRRKPVQTADEDMIHFSSVSHLWIILMGGLFPKRIGVQINEDSASQAAGSGLIPQRLGVHVNEHSATQAVFKVCPLQFSKDSLGPTSTTGYGTSQEYNVFGGPSLQMGAIRGPPAAPQGQRRKRAHKPPPSVSSPLQTAPAGSISTPALVPHIKWQDPDGIPRLTGQKCMLCKRDLSFTAEGHVFLPTRPPAVAVLPCGHTLHDHCLHRITPQPIEESSMHSMCH